MKFIKSKKISSSLRRNMNLNLIWLFDKYIHMFNCKWKHCSHIAFEKNKSSKSHKLGTSYTVTFLGFLFYVFFPPVFQVLALGVFWDRPPLEPRPRPHSSEPTRGAETLGWTLWEAQEGVGQSRSVLIPFWGHWGVLPWALAVLELELN